MATPEVNTSEADCEFVSENEVVSKKKKQTPKKDGKPPSAPPTENEQTSTRLSKKRSPYWDHFIESQDSNLAECIYCHRKIGCSGKNGTTTLQNHINTCKQYPPNIDKRQKLLDLESKTHVSEDGSVEKITVPKLWEFNQEVIRKALIKMLILDELPFTFVEREGFRGFCKVINPHFVVSHFRTSLTPRMVEALVCGQDWMRTSNNTIMIEDVLLEVEEMEAEGLKNLSGEQPTILIDETVDDGNLAF